MQATGGRVGRFMSDGNHLGDQPRPYAAPWLVPVPPSGAVDDNTGGRNLQFGLVAEPERRNQDEQNFFQNNLPISSQVPVSTGLGLALNNWQMCIPEDNGFLSLIRQELGEELGQQEVVTSRFLNLQANRLRHAVVQKMHEHQMKIVLLAENRFSNKWQEKDSELRTVTLNNMILEKEMDEERMRLDLWQQRSKHNETWTSALRQRLKELQDQNGGKKEGFGDDTASGRSGRGPTDIYFLPKEHSVMREFTTCKGCRQKEVCMLLLPCRHICLCKECESNVSLCPLCHSPKRFGLEVSV
uniref:RING-type domain-containing protein n=1 Tax=Kalanchoe fedtschenkoi TaxID=63787 RepID=A0A7N0SXI6_KALFE